MKDLTIPRWIKLARKLAARDKLWNKFVSYMYMGEEEEDVAAPKVGYDDDDVDVEDWQGDDWDAGEDEDEEDDDTDEDDWEVPHERQWLLHTEVRKDEN
jgi:hypothetical protein